MNNYEKYFGEEHIREYLENEANTKKVRNFDLLPYKALYRLITYAQEDICDYCDIHDDYCSFREKGERCDEYKTLQELIDNMKFVEEVQNENQKLEKALDITIDLIYGKKGSFVIPHNRRAYKEWVLKESEKENGR